MPDSWKLSLPCTRAEAEALAADITPLAEFDPPPALMTSETDPKAPDDWRLDAYFEEKPGRRAVALLRALVPSAGEAKPKIERVEQRDWVVLSQEGLDPIREGRFFVRAAPDATPPDGAVVLDVPASRAFGTGRHETTAGCLAMIDRLKARGRRYDAICDLGTGTGLLAFAARAAWPRAEVIASDIDPVAIEIAVENAGLNAVPLGPGPGRVELVVAAGLAHRSLKRRAPYGLVIANILAGPLIDLAPAIAAAVAPGGTLILAGLLDRQADDVAAAYRRHRMRLAERIDRGDWAILRMEKKRSFRARAKG